MIEMIKSIPCLTLELATADRAALSPAKIQAFTEEIQSHAYQDDVKCLILKGQKETFCAGFDLNLYLEDPEKTDTIITYLKQFRALIESVKHFPKPTIAAIEGQVMGGGVGLAAVCDICIATSSSTFKLPETLMGILPGVVFPFIVRRIGVAKTQFLAIGGVLTAEQALQCGLIDECFAEEDLTAALKRYVFRTSRLEPKAIKALKGLIATHFDCQDSYYRDMYTCMHNLIVDPTIKQRIASFCEGFSPWS